MSNEHAPCKGTNCGTTHGKHSRECHAEHLRAIDGPAGFLEVHHADDLNRHLVIHPSRIKTVGGAPIGYRIEGFDTGTAPLNPDGQHEPHTHVDIEFQHGDPVTTGVHGLTNEVLIAVLMHRLASFQAGPHACSENKEAMMHLHAALQALQAR